MMLKKYITSSYRVSIFMFLILLSTFNVVAQREYSVCFYDSLRSRVIPVTVYSPAKESKNTQVVIFNHGYDGNQNPKSNQTYSYLTRFLAEKGFYVISIQHEQLNDPPLPMEGNLAITRLTNWKRGELNILFALETFKALKPTLDWSKLILIGHSNGGDMAMLCATDFPHLFSKVISLDHRRMPMPRTSSPRLYTLRGCDYEADAGVLPNKKEEKEHQITIVKLDGITHSDMGERGTKEQHNTINQYLYKFLKK